MPSITRRIAVQLLVCAAVYLSNAAACAAQQSAGEPSGTAAKESLTVDQVVSRMEQRNQERAAALRTYEGTRTYRMQYRGFFGSHDAEIVVAVKASPSEKEFTVESQSGSKFIIDHVLKKLLDGEKEATDDQARSRTALNSRNYSFTLVGLDDSAGDPQYILSVFPKTDEKYLYRGRIWVDSNDFAVTRIEAEPARSPLHVDQEGRDKTQV
jgi:outer membrane lipoprotein-sorting protein